MALCRCGGKISKARLKAGYKVCLECGEAAAKIESQDKFKRTVQLGHKQGFGYVGDAETSRKFMRNVGGKYAPTAELDHNYSAEVFRSGTNPKPQPKPRCEQIGLYWVGGQSYCWFRGVDPASKGATRTVLFAGKKA